MLERNVRELSRIAVDIGFKLHRDLGPGLLETVYEQLLAAKLQQHGLLVARQPTIDIEWVGCRIPNAFRADLLVENLLLIEVKSVEKLLPVHAKQVITYLKLLDLPVGLLMNFGGATLKEGLRRLLNDPSFVSSCLRANHTP